MWKFYIVLLLTCATVPKAWANDVVPSCQDVISQCAKTIKARNAQITEAERAHSQATVMLGMQAKEIVSLKEDKERWFRDWKVTGTIGVLVGLVIAGLVSK